MVDKKTENYILKSYVRGYHLHQKYGRQWLKNILWEPQNSEDKNAFAVVKDGFVVGPVPKCFSLWMSMFLWLPKSSIICKITGNIVNRGAGNGLEIPCEYSGDGDRQAVDWLKRKILFEKIFVESLININCEGRSRKRKAMDSWEHKTSTVLYNCANFNKSRTPELILFYDICCGTN